MPNQIIQDYATQTTPDAASKVFMRAPDDSLFWADPDALPDLVNKLPLAGGTLTGDLVIAKTSPTLRINATGSNDSGDLYFSDGGVIRWAIERRGVDGNLIFRRYSAAGASQSDVIQLNVDGSVDMMSAAKVDVPTPSTNSNAATKGYVDTAAATGDALRVAKAGDTMTGDLTIAKTVPVIYLNATGAGDHIFVNFQDGGVTRWQIVRDGAAGDFFVRRLDAAGVTQDYPFVIRAANGYVEHGPLANDLSIVKSLPVFSIDAAGTNDAATIYYRDGGVIRWAIYRSGTTGNLVFQRHDMAGAVQDQPLTLAADGTVSLGTLLTSPLVANTSPRIQFTETDAAADQQRWRIMVDAGQLVISALNDAGTVAPFIPIVMNRATGVIQLNGVGVTAVHLPATTFNGLPTVSHIAPRLYLYETDAAVDARRWRLIADGGNFTIDGTDDAETIQKFVPFNANRATGAIAMNGLGVTGITLPLITNDVQIVKASPTLVLNATGANDHAILNFADGGIVRWQLFRDGNTGHLHLRRYDATPTSQGQPLTVQQDGVVTFAGAPSVIVPTPTAADHAARKDYVDTADGLRVLKAGDAMTGDLSIGKSSPTLNLNATGTNDTAYLRLLDGGVIRWTLYRDGGNGHLAISQHDAVGSPTAYPLVINSVTGAVDLTGAASVTVPAISGVNQAARVTAYDAATGRLAIGGHEVGNTGRRNITALLVNGWTASAVIIQRIGNRVSIELNNLSGAAATGQTILTIPFGFIPHDRWTQLMYPRSAAWNSAVRSLFIRSDTQALTSDGNGQADCVYAGSVAYADSYVCAQAWPTTLPGTAA